MNWRSKEADGAYDDVEKDLFEGFGEDALWKWLFLGSSQQTRQRTVRSQAWLYLVNVNVTKLVIVEVY